MSLSPSWDFCDLCGVHVDGCSCPRCDDCNEYFKTLYDGRCGRCAAKRLDLEGQLELSVIDLKLGRLLKEKRSA
jgi:hypothetical protein